MRSLACALLLAVAAFAPARAATPLQVADIVSQQQQIREEVEAGQGAYQDMPAATRKELLARQDTLFKLLDGKTTTDDLNLSERTDAFNALEWINATVTGNEDERLVCRREKPVGSNMAVRVCKTVAQMRKDREAAREGRQAVGATSQLKPPVN